MRLYRLLLRAYPEPFRRLYATEMEAAFRDLHVRAQGRGAGAVAGLWVRTTLDVLRTGLSERLSGRGYRFGASRVRLPRSGVIAFVADTLLDVRQALRGLAAAPGYTAAVVATLALGIGANTALFSVAYGVLLKPLPFGSGERLVRLVHGAPGFMRAEEGGDMGFSVLDIEDYGSRSVAIEEVAEYHRMSFTLIDARGPHRVRAGVVSSNFSEFLGLTPLHGRLFDPSEDHLGAAPVLVLAHPYWIERFGGDPQVVGRRVRMNGAEHEIVGVLPPTPQFPHTNDVYLPVSVCPTRSDPGFIATRDARMMFAYARLRPGRSVDEARLDLERVAGELRAEHAGAYPVGEGYRIDARPLRDEMVAGARPVVVALVAVSAFLLVIACANAASLALARAGRRRRELTVRNALGAGRGRLARSLLAESVMLALVGGVVGLAVAWAGHDLLVRFAARFTTRAQEIQLDRTALVFTAAASVLTGLVFGGVPGWWVGRARDLARLDGWGRTPRRGDRRGQRALVGVQVAVAFAVVTVAGLTLRTAWSVSRAELGFDTESVLSVRLNLDGPRYDHLDSIARFWKEVRPRIAAVPGVVGVGRSLAAPLGDGEHDHREAFYVRDRRDGPGNAAAAAWRIVDAGALDVLGVERLEGRMFADSMGPLGRVALVNASFRDRYLSDREKAVGAWLVRCDEGARCNPPMRVIGVVADARLESPDRPVGPEVFEPAYQVEWAGETLLIRFAGTPDRLEAGVREAVSAIDPDLAVSDVATLEQNRSERTAPHRFFATLLLLFAAVGVGLALTGVFGVTSLAATARMHELGIRKALGAARTSLGGVVVGEALRVLVPGLIAGFALSLLGGRLLRVWLPGLAPLEPVTLVAGAVLFVGAALLAAGLPARRAATVDVRSILEAP